MEIVDNPKQFMELVFLIRLKFILILQKKIFSALDGFFLFLSGFLELDISYFIYNPGIAVNDMELIKYYPEFGNSDDNDQAYFRISLWV